MRVPTFVMLSFACYLAFSPLYGCLTSELGQKVPYTPSLNPVRAISSADNIAPSITSRIRPQQGVTFLSSSTLELSAPKSRQQHNSFPPRNRDAKVIPEIIRAKVTKQISMKEKAEALKEKLTQSEPLQHADLSHPSKIIFHAFNMPYDKIRYLLKNKNLVENGYTHIQISPSQKSMRETIYDPGLSEKEKWALRYLPTGYDIDNCYGNEARLKELATLAKRKALGLIGDLVFNHVAGLYGFENDHWEAASKTPVIYRTLLWRLFSELEGFSMYNARTKGGSNIELKFISGDKETYQRCMEDFEDWVDGKWFMGAIPKLKPTPNVISMHLNYMETLIQIGFAGFRFDAADHIHPIALQAYIKFLKEHPRKPWFYLEIAEADSHKFPEFTKIAPITHYPAFHVLKDIFSYHGDLRRLQDIGYNVEEHVVFGETHDTNANRIDSRKGIAAYIQDPIDTELAISAYTARCGGNPLILSENAQSPFVAAAVIFRSLLNAFELCQPLNRAPGFYESIYSNEKSPDPHNFIFMLRSGVGLAVFNKSDKKLIAPYNTLPVAAERFINDFVGIKADTELAGIKKFHFAHTMDFLFPKVRFVDIKSPCLVVEPRSATFYVDKAIVPSKFLDTIRQCVSVEYSSDDEELAERFENSVQIKT